MKLYKSDNTSSLDDSQYHAMSKAFDLFTYPELVQEYKNLSGNSMKPVSDGHHTFDDLYMHRRVLSSIIFNLAKDYAWKSHKHADGTMFDGDFIVGVSIPDVGDYSYHYSNDYWDEFKVPEVEHAPTYDGHTPDDIDRLYSLIPLLEKKFIK